MKNKKIVIGIVSGIIAIVGLKIVAVCKDQDQQSVRGGIFTGTKQIAYDNEDSYKNLNIKVNTTSNEPEKVTVKIESPKKEVKELEVLTNTEIQEQFEGVKGKWNVELITEGNNEVRYSVECISNNK